MFTFSKNSVTILRKLEDKYVQESILTKPLLPSSTLSAEQNRTNVIERLRKDPNVFLVMEPVNGRINETAIHSSGFFFEVSASDGEHPTASLKVSYRDAIVYTNDFEDHPEFEEGFDPVWSLLDEVGDLLSQIENEEYGFVDPDCPYFTRIEKGEEVNLFNAPDLLIQAGFQTERLSVAGWVERPVLFVHENDMVVLGSRHFDGENLFLEMKRFFNFVDADVLEKAIEKAKETSCYVRVIHWEDGSWSFRAHMDDDIDTENFIERMNADVAGLRKFIDIVTSCEGVGEDPFDTLTQQRHYFIYETLEESRKLSELKI